MATWRMAFRVGSGGESLWPICQSLGVAAIQYGPMDDIDLAPYARGEPRSAWSQLASAQQTSLNRFLWDMGEGDVIYVKEGPEIVGRGVIAGPYQFDHNNRILEPGGAYWQHQRPVTWATHFPPIRIQLGRSQRFVIERLTEEDDTHAEQELARFWLPAENADETDALYEAKEGDRREVVWQQIRQRRGQASFRDALIARYGRCVVSGCEVVAVLEAAHIDPYRNSGNNNILNGLLLRADIHTLFDLDLLGVEPASLQIEVHPGLAAEYTLWANRPLRCTRRTRPAHDALARRYARFQARRNCPI